MLFSDLDSITAVVAIVAPVFMAFGSRYAASFGTSAEGAVVVLTVPDVMAASFGFAVPVATLPHAIAFGTSGVGRGIYAALGGGWTC